MKKINVDMGRVFFAGFVASLLMFFLMTITHTLGLPRSNMELMLAAIFQVDTIRSSTGVWILAMASHFFYGTLIIPMFYAYLVAPHFTQCPLRNGVWWGTFLWLVAEIFIAPVVGIGLFSNKAPLVSLRLIADLIVHLSYGIALCSIIGRDAVQIVEGVDEDDEVSFTQGKPRMQTFR